MLEIVSSDVKLVYELTSIVFIHRHAHKFRVHQSRVVSYFIFLEGSHECYTNLLESNAEPSPGETD